MITRLAANGNHSTGCGCSRENAALPRMSPALNSPHKPRSAVMITSAIFFTSRFAINWWPAAPPLDAITTATISAAGRRRAGDSAFCCATHRAAARSCSALGYLPDVFDAFKRPAECRETGHSLLTGENAFEPSAPSSSQRHFVVQFFLHAAILLPV